MLTLNNLHVTVDNKPIVRGVSLTINPGEIHAVMGPNGSGKSTLANSLMGHPKYIVSDGDILINGESIVKLKPDKRAHKGLFLAFQYPKEIPGVSVSAFLRTAITAQRKIRGQQPLTHLEFRKKLRQALEELSLDASFMNRALNDGFSGGEKKKMEILQMALLEPAVAILDETDSGLDVDALKVVADGIKRLASPDDCALRAQQLLSRASARPARSIILITHYQRILHYVTPHFVHVMMEGKIVASGKSDLAEKIEREGYEWMNVKCQTSKVKSVD